MRKFSLSTAMCALPLVVSLLFTGTSSAQEFNEDSCSQIVGTLNIHWEAVGGPFAPCSGIEFTDGTLADAADGTITMAGVSVSDAQCLGIAAYTFTVSPDGLTLTGEDTSNSIPMVLTRVPGQPCFVGHWVSGEDDFLAHIAAAPFISPTIKIKRPSGTFRYRRSLTVKGVSTEPLAHVKAKWTGSSTKTIQRRGSKTWQIKIPRRVLDKKRSVIISIRGVDVLGSISPTVKRKYKRK